MGMRINLEKYGSFEEYRDTLKAFDEAIANKEIGLRVYNGILETVPSSSGLTERVSILAMRWVFLGHRVQFQKFVWPPVKITVQRKEPSKEDKQSLIQKLKATPGSISIVSRDGKTIKAPVAVLPEFFSAAGRRPTVYKSATARLQGKPSPLDFEVPLDSYKDRSVYLDFDSETIGLFLDYECCVPIDKEIPFCQLLQLYRLADYLQEEGLYYATLSLLINAANHENEEFILPEIFSAILTKPAEKMVHVIDTFYKQIRHSVEIQMKLLKQVRTAAYTSDVGLYHLGIFCLRGRGTKSNREMAMYYFRLIASTYSPAAFCLDALAKRPYQVLPEDPYAASLLQAHPVKENVALPPGISLEMLFKMSMWPDLFPDAHRNFYKRVKTSYRSVQRQYRRKLEEIAQVDPQRGSIAKYHLGRFYLEGIGTVKNERRGLELLKSSTSESARLYLATANRHIAQKPVSSLQESLRRLRESPEDAATVQFEAGLLDETIQIPRSFVPFDSLKIEGKNLETTVNLFIDFQYGLGIPADAPFETLIELYRLAYRYEIKDLLKAASELISKSFATRSADELLPQLFDLVLLDEKPSLFEASIVPLFSKQFAYAQKTTQEAFVRALEPLVIQQNGVAQNLLGRCFHWGYGVEKSIEKALEYCELAASKGIALALDILSCHSKDLELEFARCKLAADQGLSIGQLHVGFCLLDGKGVVKDAPAGFGYLEKAANQGNACAQFHVGMCYHKGEGVEKDSEKAFDFCELSVDQGELQAFYGMGLCSAHGSKIAFEWYLEGAELGDLYCLYGLAGCYKYGMGVQKNEEQGLQYYKKAADKGHLRSQFCIGLCYQDGTGVKKNLVTALEHFKKAADKGNADAQHMVGEYYSKGLVGDTKPVQAFEYYKKAADQGNNAAQQQTGIRYEDGIGVHKDLKLACKYYEMIPSGALSEFPHAANFLGQCYKTGFTRQDGTKIKPNPDNVFKYFKYAADRGIASAANEVGMCYEHGRGTGIHGGRALHYYEKAVEMDSFPEAYYFLAIRSCNSDPEQALTHMERAVDLRYAKAEYELATWHEHGSYTAAQDAALALQYYQRAARQNLPEALLRIGGIKLNGELGQEKKEGLAAVYFALATGDVPSESAEGTNLRAALPRSRSWS